MSEIEFIPLPQPPPPPPPTSAQQAAYARLENVNEELKRRIENHISEYEEFWNGSVSPEEQLAAMEFRAIRWLRAAGESVEHLGRLASICGLDITVLIPPDKFLPKRPFVIHEDGTVTLQPSNPNIP